MSHSDWKSEVRIGEEGKSLVLSFRPNPHAMMKMPDPEKETGLKLASLESGFRRWRGTFLTRLGLFLQPTLGGFNPWLLFSVSLTHNVLLPYHITALEDVEPQSEATPWDAVWDCGEPLKTRISWVEAGDRVIRMEVYARGGSLAAIVEAYNRKMTTYRISASPLNLAPRLAPGALREVSRFALVQGWVAL